MALTSTFALPATPAPLVASVTTALMPLPAGTTAAGAPALAAQSVERVPPGTRIDNVATIGDLVSNRVTLTVGGLLPVSGDITTPVLVAGLAMLGSALLAMGLRSQKRQREVVRERE